MIGVVAMVVAVVIASGQWGNGVLWVQAQQRIFFDALTSVMEAIRDQGAVAAWSLIGLSFLYGVFHAVGPGHGKTVVATYLLTQRSDLIRGLGLTAMAAFFQGLTAIVAVEVTVLVLEIPLRRARGVADDLEVLSYGLVVVIGLFLVIGALRHLVGHGHHHHHGLDADAAGERAGWGWRKLAAVAFAIGLRPCSGALLILLLAYALQLRWAGLGAVAAMSFGTALAIGCLAVLTVFMRQRAEVLVSRFRGDHHHEGSWFVVVSLIGGVLIILLGISLLDTALSVPEHPLF
ncbi:MAG: hypothetical protein HOL02_12710 [Rhodospirillaceae bacterium]|nr:hypothetical protein [Rhodospirillaceae bacterium]MBT7648507.1 hypothetical protein [Rhodospirillaceae bacterium]